jgi:hypothetical protein
MWTQHLIVLLIVATSLGYVGWQGFRALAGRKSKLGSCCAKGCATVAEEQAKSTAGNAGKVQFMPVEMLTRKHSR